MTETPVLQATINGVTVDSRTPGDLRAAAVQELLRQEAVAEGLLEPSASDDATAEALEALLEKHVSVPSPDEAELGRYFDAHRTRYSNGELVFASHILLQMTPGTPVAALLARAESLLHQVQANPARFEQIARENSNCPSAELGGSIGQVQRGDTVPEFESALFADGSVGLWPSIVRTRYGFHIVRIDRREAGRQLPFEAARERVAQDLQRQTLAQALQQYVRIVAGRSDIQGVDLDGASSPLIN